MEAVNLLPAYARPGHPWAAVGKDLSAPRVLKAGSVVACVAVLGLGLGYVYERSVVNDKQAALADVQAEVAVADAKAAPLRAAQAAAAARMAAAGTVSSRRIAWERQLRDLSRVLPSQVYLQSLSMQSPTPLASGAVDGRSDRRRCDRLLGNGCRVVARARRARPRPAREPAVAVERDARVEHERRRGRNARPRGDTFSVTADFNPTGGAK